MKLLKKLLIDHVEHIKSNTILVGEFNIALSPLGTSTRLNLNKEILDVKEEIEEMNLIVNI